MAYALTFSILYDMLPETSLKIMVKLYKSELNAKKSMPAGTLFFNVRYLIYLHNIIFVFKLMYRNRLR